MQITICGGGNAAHTSAGLFAAQNTHRVHVYLPFGDEARRWKDGIARRGGITVVSQGQRVTGRPDKISSNPGDVIPGSQLVLLAMPSFAHESTLTEIKPYLDEGALVGALAARGSFDLAAWDMLEEKSSTVSLFGLQTLPWACRITEYGQEVAILGTKASVDFATCPPDQAQHIAQFLGDELGISLEPIWSFLSLTLAGTGQIIHPGVMYGQFHDWDGEKFDEAPLFYQGIDDYTADVLQNLSDEIQLVRCELEASFDYLDLSAVRPLDEWLCRSYADHIQDESSLRTYFTTNSSYIGLRVPMRQTEDGLVPDFRARYLTEDVPYGLLAARGIAELAGVPTPSMDRVIHWSQGKLGKEYLVDGKLVGKDVGSTRAPQRFGYQDMQSMIDAMFCPI